MQVFERFVVGSFLVLASNVLGQDSLEEGKAKLVYRTSGEGKINLQVQSWSGAEAPIVNAKSLKEGAEGVTITSFEAMDADGFWQRKEFETSQLKPGLYKLSIDGVKGNEGSSLLEKQGEFETIRGSIDHGESQVTWKQSQPGMVRVLFQFPSGLTVATPGGWELCSSGEQSRVFDPEFSGDISLRNHPSLAATIQVANFRQDILVISGKEQGFLSKEERAQMELPEQELKFSVSALTEGGKKSSKLEAGGALRLELAPKTASFLNGRRFEILLYLDGEFIHEESQGVSPYTYLLPATLPENSQTLTVNVLDYAGNWGVETLLWTRKEKDSAK